VRSPFHSESEAFRSVVLLVLGLIPLVLAATFGPAWLAIAVLAVLLGALALWVAWLRVRMLRGVELPVKMAPPHVGSAEERRILVVANDTLQERELIGELADLAALRRTRVLVLVPALVSPIARLTGAVDGPIDQARLRLRRIRLGG
jgi:hypothetical protein